MSSGRANDDPNARFGVFLPSYVWPGDGRERARGIIDFARKVEDLGFDSLFITDHLLAAKRFYSVSWLEPLATLSLVAGVTQRVRLGTSILILPLREPVMLAKQIATLQFLSDGRYILGAGVGWYRPEFEAVGTHKSERGARTDEILEIVMPLLAGETVRHAGRFHTVDGVAIEPVVPGPTPVWVGGGSQLDDASSPEQPVFAPSVMERILRADGWIPRPTAPAEVIKRDWQALQVFLQDRGRDPSSIDVVHENFLHLVLTTDRAKAVDEQHRAFERVMSNERGRHYLETVYLFGTPDDVVASLQARVDAGVESFILHTLTPDLDQLDAWTREIIPHVRFPDVAT
jgi:probable F420-dependent oxidoreductase